jgi:hypothetical protein
MDVLLFISTVAGLAILTALVLKRQHKNIQRDISKMPDEKLRPNKRRKIAALQKKYGIKPAPRRPPPKRVKRSRRK